MGGADIVSVGLSVVGVGLTNHGAHTVRAADQPRQGIDRLGAGRHAGVLAHQSGNQFKFFSADNGLVGVFHPHPFIPGTLHHGPHLIIGRGALSLLQYAQINLVLQNAAHADGGPLGLAVNTVAGFIVHALGPFVLHGREHSREIEAVCDGFAALPRDALGKNLPHYLGGVWVDDQPVFVVRVLGIAERRERTDEIPVAPLHVQMAADFFGGVAAEGVVEQVLHRHNNVAGTVQMFAVITVIDCDEAYSQGGKQLRDIPAAINVVSAEPRKVFDNYAVDPAAIHIGQEPLEIFTVGIRPGFAVIHIYILLGSIIELVQMGLVVLFQKPPLVDNAVAFVPTTE